jgi:hypothetical protein
MWVWIAGPGTGGICAILYGLRRLITGKGFHVMFDGDAPHENVSKWNVNILRVDRARRHLDAGIVGHFWSIVDKDIFERKPFLLPKGVTNVAPHPSSAAQAPGSVTA